MMLTWLLLVSLVCVTTQDGDGPEDGECVILSSLSESLHL